jgi:ubiquinone/menaquinone biosynthesis C-methylase UbiE
LTDESRGGALTPFAIVQHAFEGALRLARKNLEINLQHDAYRSIAPRYDRLFQPLVQGLRVLGLRLFLPQKGSAVLDMGCGTGQHLALYRKLRCNLYGLDLSPAMLSVARKRLGADARLHLGDASHMPFCDSAFDLVIAMLALHEMKPITRSLVMGEMIRVLKPGGHMLVIDFHPGPIRGIEGWGTKLVILASEVAAGREHFRNQRQFLATQGLQPLIRQNGLQVVGQRVVGGGAVALYLLSR